jgi:hypothetical protein
VTVPTSPPGFGARRAVPENLDEEQRERLRWLLEDPDSWVLRPGWETFLRTGDRATLLRPEELTRDHRIAALAWLRQQRHRLYHVLEGERIAPAGWLEGLGIYQRLLELVRSPDAGPGVTPPGGSEERG